MRIALTGSHGYVGRHLHAALKEREHRVECFDLKIGRPYLELLYEPFYDVILHLAAFSNVGASHKTLSLLAANVTDLATLMVGLRSRNYEKEEKFVFISSSAVYALPESGPYGLSKALGEEIVKAALPGTSTVVRPFNVVGGRWPDDTTNDHLIPKIVHAALCGKPFQLYGSGHERRYYVHVDELVKTIVKIVDGELPQSEIEVRSDEAFTVREVISQFLSLRPANVDVSAPFRILDGPARRDNPQRIDSHGSMNCWRETCSAQLSIKRAFKDYLTWTGSEGTRTAARVEER